MAKKKSDQFIHVANNADGQLVPEQLLLFELFHFEKLLQYLFRIKKLDKNHYLILKSHLKTIRLFLHTCIDDKNTYHRTQINRLQNNFLPNDYPFQPSLFTPQN